MTLRDLAARHARHILGNTQGGFAESITYRFANGDPDRVFAALVKRLDLQQSSPLARPITKRRLQIEIPRHATAGVLRIAKGDSILVPTRIGEDPTECSIVRMVAQDDSLFVVEVEA